jgi:hypothetical protein
MHVFLLHLLGNLSIIFSIEKKLIVTLIRIVETQPGVHLVKILVADLLLRWPCSSNCVVTREEDVGRGSSGHVDVRD